MKLGELREEIKQNCPGIPWREMPGMQDRLIHFYFRKRLAFFAFLDCYYSFVKCVGLTPLFFSFSQVAFGINVPSYMLFLRLC